MREFVFALEYDPGTNPVADVLATHGDATVRSLSCHVTPESLWRVDRAVGSDEALEALEAAYRDGDFFADCLVRDDCGADCQVDVLDRGSDGLVVYTYWDRTDECASVPHLAREYLGDGLLFETYREDRRYRWRIVLANGAPVGEFFDALSAEAGACAGIDVLRWSEIDPESSTATKTGDGLSPAQRRAVLAAVDHGYYETPREIELTDLAEELEIPRSTLSYRLRRAEATFAKTYANDELASERAPQA